MQNCMQVVLLKVRLLLLSCHAWQDALLQLQRTLTSQTPHPFC
jgi:hypothetical protein